MALVNPQPRSLDQKRERRGGVFVGYLSLKRAGVAGFVLLALSCTVRAEQPNTPLDNLLKSKTDSVCFRRDYDAAHLKRHPGQMTEAIMLSYRWDGVRIELKQKDRKVPRYITAGCDWSENRNVQGHPQDQPIPAFKKNAGYDCIVIISPSSAQGGGSAIIDPASDGQSLMLYIDDPVGVQDSLAKDADVPSFKLGHEDRQFQLTRTDTALCKPMEDALELPYTHRLNE